LSYHWFKIFEKEESPDDYLVPNTFIQFQFKGEKICVTKTSEGMFAFSDRCPHNGASLSKGFCTQKNEIVCPLHRYSFDLKTGKATSGGAFALKLFPLEFRDDGVYVGIKASWWEM
jgi:3-phenylpropionate/trans-cinnamate dioxygenase ferredoxin subunit